MTIPAFPAILRPAQVLFRLRAMTQQHRSPFDGSVQTLQMPGARWVATLTWPSLEEADRRSLDGFLAGLGGRAGRFIFGPEHATRRATGSGTIVINTAGQSGPTLYLRGFGAGDQAMRVGDWLSYTDTSGRLRLHQATADVTADGSGHAEVPIAPPIRRSGADGAAVEIDAPAGVFMLAEDEVGITMGQLFGSATIEIEEALV